jgi:EmrB/QacA subfamily drug resistance transporter
VTGSGSMPGGAGTEEQLSLGTSRGRWVIAATVLGSGISALDATVVGIALPSIGRDFHSGVGTLQWVVSGYALTLAAFLLLGGSLGDRLGRRRMFSIGVVWFAVASVCCGIAPNAGVLIAARILQGVGGALLAPASLAIIQASFRPDDRPQAIGAWSGLGGVATAAGPLLGGYLIVAGSWRWVFFINIPVAITVLLVTARHVPESRDPSAAGHVDAVGAALAVLFLAGLTYGLIEAPSHGWASPAVLTGLVVAGLAGPAFLVVERASAHPMLQLGLFRSHQFTSANAVTFVVYGALGGSLFLLPVELQLVAHYSPLEAGMALLPVTVIMLAFSARSGKLAARIGPRLQMSVGPLVVGAGLLLLTRATNPGSYVTQVLPAVVVFGAGLAITVAPLTSTALGAAPSEHAGVASAVNNVVARAAGLLAVAVLPLLAGITGSAALEPLQFSAGFRTAMVISGLTCAAGGLLASATIRNPPGAPRLLQPRIRGYHCALDSTPLRAANAARTPGPRS